MPNIYHAFVNPKADLTDTTVTRPSDWNAQLQYGNAAATAPSGTAAIIRETLTANRTYYVRTDGSNSNTGLVNSAGGAFATWAYAYNSIVCSTLDLNGKTVTIQGVAGQTFSATETLSGTWLGAGSVILDGGGCTISVAVSLTGAFHIGAVLPSGFTIQNFTLANSSYAAIYHFGSGGVNLGPGLIFGVSTYHMLLQGTPAILYAFSDITVTGNATNHLLVLQGGNQAFLYPSAWTASGTITFSGSTVAAQTGGYLESQGVTFTGTVLGQRYLADTYGYIFTNSGGANYFPGNSAGTVNTPNFALYK